jgi:hypothetical protein
VRRLTPDDQEVVEEKRNALVAMFVHLKDLQTSAGIIENTANENPILDDETEYDEYDEETVSATITVITPIERKVIILPSNGNVVTNHADLEITFRKRQAHSQLVHLRDLIADISFQFSHVIRGQIRKKIRTRSQKRVKSLHNELTLHARIYTRCRNHLVALNCGQSILAQFRVLTREDLKASTAILDPNKSGSTSIQLSWIWHSGKWLLMNDNALDRPDPDSDNSSGPVAGPGPGSAPDPDPLTLYECKTFIFVFACCNRFISVILVKRVHFLRARALRNRWKEEHILLNYEMQWTVRFFQKKSELWKLGADTPDIPSGAKAYALRQESQWHAMAVNSDRVFKNSSSHYVTPIV